MALSRHSSPPPRPRHSNPHSPKPHAAANALECEKWVEFNKRKQVAFMVRKAQRDEKDSVEDKMETMYEKGEQSASERA